MTETQINMTKDYLHKHLTSIFEDYFDREYFIDNIIDLIIEDIDVCADWSDYEDDEINGSDINIALARILYNNVSNFE